MAEGIGDTIRVSLTEAPEKEIPVCYSILQALGLRKTMVEYVACPSCGRTLFNLETVLHEVREQNPDSFYCRVATILNEFLTADYAWQSGTITESGVSS